MKGIFPSAQPLHARRSRAFAPNTPLSNRNPGRSKPKRYSDTVRWRLQTRARQIPDQDCRNTVWLPQRPDPPFRRDIRSSKDNLSKCTRAIRQGQRALASSQYRHDPFPVCNGTAARLPRDVRPSAETARTDHKQISGQEGPGHSRGPLEAGGKEGSAGLRHGRGLRERA